MVFSELDFQAATKNASEEDFFGSSALAKAWEISENLAELICYATSRSWWREEMFDELIRLECEGEPLPKIITGEFRWENGKFI